MAEHSSLEPNEASRRRFLIETAATASTLAVPYFVPASVLGADAPSNRVAMGCIGTGNQGLPILERFMNHADCQIVAVCDVNRGSYGYREEDQFRGREPAKQAVEKYYAQRKPSDTYRGCHAYNDFRELLARDDIDAVTIVTPDHWHAVMTILAAKAGKDIYCEKPLALTIGQQQAMIKAVRQQGRILQVGLQERSNPTTRFACELVRNGRIGEVKTVTTHVGLNNKVGPGPGWQPMPVPDGFDYDLWLGPAPEAPYHQDRCLYRFRFNYDYSGGQVTNYGTHSNDMAQWALGMDESGPVEVEYLDAQYLPKGSLFNTATHTKFRCRYATGAELVCETKQPDVRVVFEGTEGRVVLDNESRTFETVPENLKSTKLGPNDVRLYRSDDHQRNFLDCVKSRDEPAVPVEVGHRSTTVCHLGNIAIKLKRRLQWDPALERFTDCDEANQLLHRVLRAPWRSATASAG